MSMFEDLKRLVEVFDEQDKEKRRARLEYLAQHGPSLGGSAIGGWTIQLDEMLPHGTIRVSPDVFYLLRQHVKREAEAETALVRDGWAKNAD